VTSLHLEESDVTSIAFSPGRPGIPVDVTLLNYLGKQRYVDRIGLGLVGSGLIRRVAN